MQGTLHTTQTASLSVGTKHFLLLHLCPGNSGMQHPVNLAVMAVVLGVTTLVGAVTHDIRADADIAMVGDALLYHGHSIHHPPLTI